MLSLFENGFANVVRVCFLNVQNIYFDFLRFQNVLFKHRLSRVRKKKYFFEIQKLQFPTF